MNFIESKYESSSSSISNIFRHLDLNARETQWLMCSKFLVVDIETAITTSGKHDHVISSQLSTTSLYQVFFIV